MKRAFSILMAAAALGLAGTFGGCASDPDENTIPWSRPQSWEGQVPGLGTQ